MQSKIKCDLLQYDNTDIYTTISILSIEMFLILEMNPVFPIERKEKTANKNQMEKAEFEKRKHKIETTT